MKRCPECRRDYYDETLLYCLDDGSMLLDGPASMDGPSTAILSAGDGGSSEAATQAQVPLTDETAILPTSSGDVARNGRWTINKLWAIPILLVVVILTGFLTYRYFQTSSDKPINSIAVLPFANASGDKETEFLSDGISETLINNFTKIPELKVAARSTAFRFRGREDDPKEIGRELGVGSILTGKMMQRGDSISVQVDLVNTSDGLQIWGNRYDGKASDIVSIQQRIATDVSSELKLALTGAQAQQISKTYTQNPQAYQHYLRGRYYWNKRTADDLRKGLAEFQRAADVDPNYALAYVGLADTYVLLEEYAGVASSESLPQARTYAEKALQIDNSLGEAYATLGLINNRDWRWADSDREFKRAIELNPNYPTVHHWHSINLRDTGKFAESMAEIKTAQRLDPLSGVIGVNVAISYMNINDYPSAMDESQKVIALDPNWWAGHHWLGNIHLKFGNTAEAISELQRAVELSNRSNWPLAFLAYAYAISNRRAEALAILRELETRYSKRECLSIQLAAVHAGLGDKDEVFNWLERSFQERSGELIRIKSFPQFDSIRSDPRYADLMKRMNFPD